MSKTSSCRDADRELRSTEHWVLRLTEIEGVAKRTLQGVPGIPRNHTNWIPGIEFNGF